MNNLILATINLLAIPLLHPFFYGLLGINIFAVYGLMSFRHNLSTTTLLTAFIFSILSDVAFSLNLGTTFLSITIMCLVDQLLRKIVPNENFLLEILHSFISFSIFFISLQILGRLGRGNGFQLYSTVQELLSVLFISFIMSILVLIITGIRSRFVGGGLGSSKIIKL